jgi:hypothetical protein
MKNKTDEAWGIFHDIMRNHPLWPSTFSTCQCGRMMARGAGPCAKCLEERLAEIAGPILARDAVNALENVQDVWEKIRVKTKAEK